MSDSRPDRVYGILVRDGHVFMRAVAGRDGLPGGVFRPMAEDRKVELKAHIYDQLGIEAAAVWAQGAFQYHDPAESRPFFSGFYSVWEWNGDPRPGAGRWLNEPAVAAAPIDPSLKILLTSVINTLALRTR